MDKSSGSKKDKKQTNKNKKDNDWLLTEDKFDDILFKVTKPQKKSEKKKKDAK